MEEIITIDGKQFKLSTDRPLTAQEKAHTIGEIRKQTGCGTCGTKAVQPKTMNSQIKSMAACTATNKTGGSTITLTLTAVSGVAPYTTDFFKDLGLGRVNINTNVVGRTGTIASDGGTDGGIYTITDADVASANYGALAQIQFVGKITDSCPTGPLTCEQACEVTIACVTPTCNFAVA